MTTEALKKGKPSPGTKKDKRLEENQYADEGHFHGETVQAGWNGAASRFSDEQYKKACAACDPGGGTPKEACFLPHHEPGGALNADGVHAAAQRISSLSGHSPEAVAKAKAHLRGHYATLGDEVPDVLKASALEVAAFGVEDGYEALTFAPVQFGPMEGDCGLGMEMDPATGKCMPSKEGKAEKSGEDTKGAKQTRISAADDSTDTAPWRGPLTVEGIETGDGRQFDNDSLTWADLPLPLRWNRVDSHGGEQRTEAVNVGRIDKIWREDSGLIMGEGVLDLSDEDGRRAHSKVKGQMLRGVSVDVDSVKDADMELVWAEPDPDAEGDPDPFAQLFAAPEKIVFHKGRIRAATLVDIPAFAEAYIALLDGEGAVVAGGQRAGNYRQYSPTTVLTRNTVDAPLRPPAEWFTNPDLSVPTPITVTPDGRVYGHAALWGTCHVGQTGMCVTPPHEESHPYFMTGAVVCEGEDSPMASVGQITVGTNHADISLGYRAASDHYDNTGAAVADVTVGNDAHGIWVAGSVRSSATAEQVHELRASGQVSGDWRNVGGSLRLVGLLAVNVPGFPVPKLRTKYTEGRQLALVASGMPNLREQLTEDELDQLAYRRIMGRLGQRVRGEE